MLNLIISGKMAKYTYLMMRDLTNTNLGTSDYPSYRKILAAKRRCYPEPSAITVTETSAEVGMQHLLDHVSSRLLQITHEDLLKLDSECLNNLKLILKWGCHGFTGQQYKQVFDDENSSDANVFFTSRPSNREFFMNDL